MKRMFKLRTKAKGAIVVTFALFLMMMLGFMGLAMDLGHLHVIRTELQTSMDACALAGAQELNGQPDTLTRAANAGMAAGNANAVDLQSATWKSKAKITAGEITFFDQAHASGATAATARFVRCTHTQAGTSTPLLRMLPGMTASAATMNVGAFAEATTTPAQSTCPVPLALHPKAGGAAPNYGFAIGEWITLLSKSTATNGQIGWANLDGSTNASETEAELNGFCGTKVGSQLGTPGVQGTIADTWNARFGMYKNNSSASADPPDFTGYAYTTKNSAGSNMYSDFVAKRQLFASCAASVADCETATGLKLNQFKTLATPGPSGELARYGANRRLVAVPVVNAANQVTDFVCMLLLQPIPSPFDDVKLEFRGNASTPGSPCTANGLPGGTAGPLVPVLVR